MSEEANSGSVSSILTAAIQRYAVLSEPLFEMDWETSTIQQARKFTTVAKALIPFITEGDSGQFALTTFLREPTYTQSGFLVILDSRVIVAWRKGLIFKTSEVKAIEAEDISEACVYVITEGSMSGTKWLNIKSEDFEIAAALPAGDDDVSTMVRQSVLDAVPA